MIADKVYADDVKKTLRFATKDTEMEQCIMEKDQITEKFFFLVQWKYL